MLLHTGTIIHCRGCGREYKRPVVSVDLLNDARREVEQLRDELTQIKADAHRVDGAMCRSWSEDVAELEALRGKVTPKDVLVLSVGPRVEEVEASRVTAQALHEATGCSVLIVSGEATLRSLDEDQMRAHGWVRA